MRFKSLDIIGVLFVVIVNVGWTLLPNRPLIIGIILAVPLIFVLPGYSLTQVVFPRRLADPSNSIFLQPNLKIEHPISAVDHITLSLGLSMAIDVLMGFILNVFPIGLQGLSWTISLGLVTTVFTLLATYLRRKDRVKVEKISGPRITIRECIQFGLAILVAIASVLLSVIRPSATEASFTQFSMQPTNQTNNSCAVRIGVKSFEATTVTYRITVAVNDVQVNTWPTVILVPQHEWDQLVALPATSINSLYVEAKLYKLDQPEAVYREVHVTLNSLGGSKDRKIQC